MGTPNSRRGSRLGKKQDKQTDKHRQRTDGRAESPQRGFSWMDKNGRKGSAGEKRLGGEGEEG